MLIKLSFLICYCHLSHVLLKDIEGLVFPIMAFITLIFGMILIALRNFSIVPFNALTNYSFQLKMGLIVIFLSFAPVDRINIMKKEKQVMQAWWFCR